MSATTSSGYAWIKKIPSSLRELDTVPLLGSPSFPWEELTTQLQKHLNLKQLALQPSEFKWRTAEELFLGMGAPLLPLTISVTPLEGMLYFALTEDDLRLLMTTLLLNKESPSPLFDKEMEEGFYEFLALETIYSLNSIPYDKDLSPRLIKPGELPKEPMLTMDVLISLGENTAPCRLFVSSQLSQSLKTHYLRKRESAVLSSPLSEQLEVTVHLEAGSTTLSLEEWSEVRPGDFLLLDSCSLKAGEDKGRIMITLNGHPFFRAKVKEGNIKILEHPLYYEVGTMNAKKTEEEFEDEEEEEEDEDEETEDEEEDEDEETEDEEDEEEEEEEEEEEDEEEEDEEEDEETEEEEEEEEEEQEEEEKEEKKTKATQTQVVSEKKAITPKEIPVTIVVEIGRLQMTVQTLMDLKPGNLLELNVHPESGVDLVANGSRIGKGELLQIGDTLGVRVLEKG